MWEVGPSLAEMTCDGHRVNDIPVLVCIQKRPAATQGIVNLFRSTGLVVMKGQEIANCAPEIELPLRQLIWQRRRVGGGVLGID